MKLFKLLFAFIVLVLVFAPAAAQPDLPPVPNVRFADDAGTVAWDAPPGDLRVLRFTIDVYGTDGTNTATDLFDALSSARSQPISAFLPTWNWRVRVSATY